MVSTVEYLLRPEVERRHKRQSAIITAIIMAIILLLAIFWVFARPEPPFPEEGILISFGDISSGSGEIEPQQNEEMVQPTPTPATSTEQVDEIVSTQDVNATEVNVQQQQPRQQTPVQQPTQQPVQTQETQQEPTPETPKYTYNPSGQNPSSTSTSQGHDPMNSGNIGDPSGGNNNNPMGSTVGGNGSPFGHGLGGRGLISYPGLPRKQRPEQGIAAFEVCINSAGVVTEIRGITRNNQITDPAMLEEARAAIRKLKFSESNRGLQCGEITLTFTY